MKRLTWLLLGTALVITAAHGSRFGGHALFIKDKKLHYVYNFLGVKPEQTFVSTTAVAGRPPLPVERTRE